MSNWWLNTISVKSADMVIASLRVSGMYLWGIGGMSHPRARFVLIVYCSDRVRAIYNQYKPGEAPEALRSQRGWLMDEEGFGIGLYDPLAGPLRR